MKRFVSIVLTLTSMLAMLCNCTPKHEYDLCVKDVSLTPQKGKLYLGMSKDEVFAVIGNDWRQGEYIDSMIVCDNWENDLEQQAVRYLNLMFDGENKLRGISYYLSLYGIPQKVASKMKSQVKHRFEKYLGSGTFVHLSDELPPSDMYSWQRDNNTTVRLALSELSISISLMR